MNRQLLKDLPKLINAGIITEEIAGNIADYYQNKKDPAPNQLFVIFGILGSILVGAGLILIIAHNWEDMGMGTQTLMAFLPLIIGQAVCLYALLKQYESLAWREASSAFLFFAVGACIALIGQIYNIPGTVSSFLFTWMLLVAPLMYVMRSSIVSLLYIILITYYGYSIGYVWRYGAQPHWYWVLLAIVLPYYYLLYKKSPQGSFIVFHHWLIPISISTLLAPLVGFNNMVFNFLLYNSLYGFFYNFGQTPFAGKLNGYTALGAMGTIVMLLIGSFRGFWGIFESLRGIYLDGFGIAFNLIFGVAAVAMLVWRYNQDKGVLKDPLSLIFLAYIPIFFIGMYSDVAAMLLSNLAVATLGIMAIRAGAKSDNLGILNLGLLVVSVLIICRYFDMDIPFALRGLFFILIGGGFFVANYLMFKKRKERAE